MINDIFVDFAVHFLAHHQSHLSLPPYSSPALTNVKLLEKFKETFQLLAIVVRTMKMAQSKVSVWISGKTRRTQPRLGLHTGRDIGHKITLVNVCQRFSNSQKKSKLLYRNKSLNKLTLQPQFYTLMQITKYMQYLVLIVLCLDVWWCRGGVEERHVKCSSGAQNTYCSVTNIALLV